MRSSHKRRENFVDHTPPTPKAGCQSSLMVFSLMIYQGIARLQERCTEQMLMSDPLPGLQKYEGSDPGVTGQGAEPEGSMASVAGRSCQSLLDPVLSR